MEILLKLVMCHIVGDYAFNPYLTVTKGENWYHLICHSIMYSIPFYICFGLCWQLAVITILHIPIDAAKARYNKLSYPADQALHYLLCLLYLI
jgi:hypothetical protein